jgi:hypothetical protein
MTESASLHVVPLDGRPRAENRIRERPMKTYGPELVWIASGLLIAGGGIACALTAARHFRRYSTALLKVGPSAR